jgi:hypothetical protein
MNDKVLPLTEDTGQALGPLPFIREWIAGNPPDDADRLAGDGCGE